MKFKCEEPARDIFELCVTCLRMCSVLSSRIFDCITTAHLISMHTIAQDSQLQCNFISQCDGTQAAVRDKVFVHPWASHKLFHIFKLVLTLTCRGKIGAICVLWKAFIYSTSIFISQSVSSLSGIFIFIVFAMPVAADFNVTFADPSTSIPIPFYAAQRNQLTLTSVTSCGANGINVQSFGLAFVPLLDISCQHFDLILV